MSQGGAFIRELHQTGVMIKILQEENSFTRTYDERPVIMTGPLATVLAVQQQLLDRMATYVGREGGRDCRFSSSVVPRLLLFSARMHF